MTDLAKQIEDCYPNYNAVLLLTKDVLEGETGQNKEEEAYNEEVERMFSTD